MFFVIDKSKILSYVVAICTVVVLSMLASGGKNENSAVQTSANVIFNDINVIKENTIKQKEVNINEDMSNNLIQNDLSNEI